MKTMSEAILSQTVMPMGPEVRPVLTAMLEGTNDNGLEPAARDFGMLCNDRNSQCESQISKCESVEYLSLLQKTIPLEECREGPGKHITILNFDPSIKAQKTFVCSVCNEAFDNKDLLDLHMRCHAEEEVIDSGSESEKNLVKDSDSKIEIVMNEDEERRYGCSLCDKSFKTRYDINVHIRTHTGEKPYECTVCGKRIASSSQFSKHMRIHLREECYSCQSCGKSFHSVIRYHKHMRTVTSGGLSKTPVCVKREKKKSGRKRAPDFDVFDEQDADLAQHSRVQEGDKPYECVTCGKVFSCKSDIRRHVRVHTGKKPFNCNYCVKTFSCSSNLFTHMRRMHKGRDVLSALKNLHPDNDNNVAENLGMFSLEENIGDAVVSANTKETNSKLEANRILSQEKRKFKCLECNKHFCTKDDRDRHMECHKKDRPYKCAHCHRQYIYRYELKNHLRKHAGDKQFLCNLCGKEYFVSRSFYYHMRTAHKVALSVKRTDSTLEQNMRILTGEKPYECIRCGKRFRARSNIRLHLRVHTGEKPYKCFRCFKRFSSKSSFNSHSRTHFREKSYHCSVCNEKFSNRCNLLKHIKIHNEDNLKSDGSGNKRYFCSDCGKDFSCSGNLVKHKRIHTGEMPYECLVCHKKFRFSSNLQRHMAVFKGRCNEEGTSSRDGNVCVDKNEQIEMSTEDEKQSDFTPLENVNEAINFEKCVSEDTDLDNDDEEESLTSTNVIDETITVDGSKDERTSEGKSLSDTDQFSGKIRENAGSRNHLIDLNEQITNVPLSFRKDKNDFTMQKSIPGENTTMAIRKDEKLNNIDMSFDEEISESPQHVECSVCLEKFSDCGYLDKHMKIHTGEMPFTCSVCGKAFRLSHNLKKHKTIHEEESSSKCIPVGGCDDSCQCNVCGEIFNSSDTLNVHIENVHKQNKLFSCSLCDQTYSIRSSLYSHIKRCHKKKGIQKELNVKINSKDPNNKNLAGRQVVLMADKSDSSSINLDSSFRTKENVHLSGRGKNTRLKRKEDVNCKNMNKLKNKEGVADQGNFKKENKIQTNENVSDVSDRDNTDGAFINVNKTQLKCISKSSCVDTLEHGKIDECVEIDGMCKEIENRAQVPNSKLCNESDTVSDHALTENELEEPKRQEVHENISIVGVDKNMVMLPPVSSEESPRESTSCGETVILLNRYDTENVTRQCEVTLNRLEVDIYFGKQNQFGLRTKPHTCADCGKIFRSKRGLSKHMTIHKRNDEDLPSQEKRTKVSQKETSDVLTHSGLSGKVQVKISQKKKLFECELCGKGFVFKNSLYPHMRTHTGAKPFKCSFCPKSFNSRYDLNNHERIHTGHRPFKCPHCNKTFKTKCELNIHLRTHTGEKPYKCQMCQRTFRIHAHLKTHMRIHTGEKPFKCSVCPKEFNTRYDVKVHVRIHTGERPYQCNECGKTYISNSVLSRHMRIHTGEKPYKCMHCKKAFNRSNHLAEHLKLHTGNKPFICSICGKSFHRKVDQSVHMRIHTGEKPFQCAICGKLFYSNSNFHKHKLIHNEIKLFDCNICGKKFVTNSYLRTHMKTHVKNSFICTECGREFVTSRDLKVHNRTHQVVTEKLRHCSECGETFNVAVNYYRHMMQVHEYDTEKLAEIAMHFQS